MTDRSTPTARPVLSRIPGLRPAIALALALFLVTTGTLAGNAYWSAVASRTATVTAAGISMTSTGADGLTVAYKPGFSPEPGVVVSAPVVTKTTSVTLTNTGATPLNYSVSVAGWTPPIPVQVTLEFWKQGATCDATTVPAFGATSGSLAAPPAMPAGADSAGPGLSVVICARTTPPSNFADYAGNSITPTITFTGRVGANWTTSSSTAFTQAASYNWFNVVHRVSTRCLDTVGGAAAAGAKMISPVCSPPSASNTQAFRFEPVPNSNPRIFRIYIRNASGFVVSAAADKNNADVQLAAPDAGAGAGLQLWQIQKNPDELNYRLVNNTANGLCLTVPNPDQEKVTVAKCEKATSGKKYESQNFTFTEIP